MLRLALTVAALLALAASAQAATWSAATPPYSCPADLAFTQAGHGIAVMGDQGSVGELEAVPKIDASWAELSYGSAYGKLGKLPFEPVGFSVFGTDGFGAIGYVGRHGTRRSPVREYALLGHVSSGAGRAHRLGRARYDIPFPLVITVSSKGKSVALFGGTRGRITEFLLGTNGFKRTTLIARGRSVGGSTMTGTAGGAALAGNARGDAVIAWRNGSSVYARVRTARGRFLKTQRLGVARTKATIAAAMADSGAAIVAWAAPRAVAASYRAPGGRFSTRSLDSVDTPNVQAGFAGDRAVVAWLSREAGHTVVRAEIAGLGTIRVTPAGVDAYNMGDLATDSAGMLAIAWDTGAPDHTPYLSLLLPNSNAFAEPERIGDRNAIFAPALAIDPVSGAVVAAGPSSPVGCWFSWREP